MQWEVHNNLPLCLTQLTMSVAVLLLLTIFKEPLLKNLLYKTTTHDSSSPSINRDNGDVEEVVELPAMAKELDY